MSNIWRDGFEIKRDGETFTLTYDEIRNINRQIQADNGRESVCYFLDSSEITAEEELAAKEILEDDDACYNIWELYMEAIMYETGEAERDAVYCEIKNKMNSDKARALEKLRNYETLTDRDRNIISNYITSLENRL